MKLDRILLVLIVGLLILIMINLNGLCTFIKSGQHLFGDKVVIDIGDLTWANLPITFREEISKQHSPTKFNDKDLIQIITHYKKLLSEYKEPISLK